MTINPFAGNELLAFQCDGALVKLEGCASGCNSTLIYFYCAVDEAAPKLMAARFIEKKMTTRRVFTSIASCYRSN